MFYSCGSMEYMFLSGDCTSKYGLAMAQHNTSISPYSTTEQRYRLLHSSTIVFLFLSRGFGVVLMHALGA
jgi:hypothetical protein